eukprot:29361-Pelagococcus_subviridis.AAC.2
MTHEVLGVRRLLARRESHELRERVFQLFQLARPALRAFAPARERADDGAVHGRVHAHAARRRASKRVQNASRAGARLEDVDAKFDAVAETRGVHLSHDDVHGLVVARQEAHGRDRVGGDAARRQRARGRVPPRVVERPERVSRHRVSRRV